MWYIVPREEQETVISIDYSEKTMTFYTSRKSVAKRLEKKIGKPTKIDYSDGKITGITYVRNLYDDDIKKFMSISTIVGGFRKQNVEDDKLYSDDNKNLTD